MSASRGSLRQRGGLLPSTLLADASAVADGQLFAWSAALGHAIPVNPSGASELAIASNVTNTPLVLTFGGTASADIPGLTFTIGPTTRPVYLDAACMFQQTVVGDGSFTLTIVDVTSGNTGLSPTNFVRLPNTIAASVKNVLMSTGQPVRVGALASARTYKVTASIAIAGAASIYNSPAFPSTLRAFVL